MKLSIILLKISIKKGFFQGFSSLNIAMHISHIRPLILKCCKRKKILFYSCNFREKKHSYWFYHCVYCQAI